MKESQTYSLAALNFFLMFIAYALLSHVSECQGCVICDCIHQPKTWQDEVLPNQGRVQQFVFPVRNCFFYGASVLFSKRNCFVKKHSYLFFEKTTEIRICFYCSLFGRKYTKCWVTFVFFYCFLILSTV
jgi:hypothetical protein